MIVITIAGQEHASIYLNQRLGHFQTSSLMSAVGGLVESQIKERIARDKVSPDGQAWAPLKPSTVRKKGTTNILVDKGRLLGSITHTAGTHYAVVGTNVFYARFHQDGTRRMPARPFVGLSASNRSELERVVHAFIARQIA